MSAPPFLTREQEQSLFARWKAGDMSARERMILAHLPLVKKFALKFSRTYPFADLVHEGVCGLCTAFDRWEPERNLRFATYATWWVRHHMTEWIVYHSRTVRPPVSTDGKRRFFNGEGPETLSFDAPVYDSRPNGHRMTFAEVIPDEHPNQGVAEVAIDCEKLMAAMAKLPPRERSILEARFLTDDDQPALRAVGAKLGISPERVRQLQNRALSQLRTAVGVEF